MASAKPTTSPSFQFYPSDFLASSNVDQMSMTERGVYVTLLCRCWLDNGLPTDLKELAGMSRMKASQFERMWKEGRLSKCFVERGDRLHNVRMDRERKKQVEYKRRQSDNAGKRWEKERQCAGNATALPAALPADDAGNAYVSSSSRPVPSSESTHTPGRGAPLHTTHIRHAACGRVCVPADLHTEFVSALNRDDADKVLRDWYAEVDHEWSAGPRRASNTGGNGYQFWRARFSERWPADAAAPRATGTSGRLPAWARK